MEHNDITDGQKILNSIRRKMCKPLIVLLVIGLVIFLIAFLSDFCSICNGTICIYAPTLVSGFYDTLVAINTILAATVIFYYSIQDKMTEGVPNRTILAYTFGTYSIPAYFIISILLLPVNYVASLMGMKITSSVCTVFSYLFQIVVIILILFSNFYAFSLTAICNAEIRQYKELCNLEKFATVSNQSKPKSPYYTWTYLPHHAELVIASDELVTDKFALLRRLLGTPFYEKEFHNWSIKRFYKWQNPNDYIMSMSKKCMEKNELRKIYEFYYGNLSAVMTYLSNSEQQIMRNKMYLLLYEFLEKLQKLCLSVETSKENATQYYLIAVSGILNSVLEQSIEDAEAFCIYVLNNCITDKTLRSKQIGLYFLMQEYLYRTSANKNCVCLENISEIYDLADWSMRKEDEQLFYDFWMIWMEWTTSSYLSDLGSIYQAILTLRGEALYSAPLTYIRLSIQQIRRHTNESTDYPIDQ